MKVIFCADPLDSKKIDIDYEREYNEAKDLGFDVELINFEDLVYMADPIAAVRRIKTPEKAEAAIYRGWMLKPEIYADLYNVLKNKNIELINSPEAYKICHYLPESYDAIRGHTPGSIWFEKDQLSDSLDEVCQIISRTFGDSPIIIKDYVKSRKHEWEEACYIPDASDANRVKQVTHKFIELQGEDLNEGIVFREFLRLEFLTLHSKSKMPLTKEFRVFFLDGEPLQLLYYWDEGDYGGLKPDLVPFLEIAKKVKSRFFTMDIAKIENGSWTIIELGDGQVSGLPENADLHEFYSKLKVKAF